MKIKNQLKIGSIISYLQMALSIVIGLVYTPIMIKLLGQSEYGLYNTVSSTISMLSILSLGFNSGYIRYYAKYKKNEDKDSINRLNGLFLLVFSVIGFVALFCGLFFTANIELIFKDGLSNSEYQIATVLMFLLTINLAISFPMSVFSNIISANERFVFLKTLGILQTVVSPLVTLPLLLMGYRSIAMVSVSLSITILVDLIYIYYVLVVLGNKFVFKNFEKGLFRSLFIYSGFIAINMIIDQINWSIDKLLLARYKGTVEVAIYSVGYTLYHYYGMFSTAISGVFTPRIHVLVNQNIGDIKRLRNVLTDLFVKVGRIQFLVLSLVCTGFAIFGRQFISLWAGAGYSQSYYVALLLMITASIALTQNIGLEVQRAQDKHQFRSFAYAIMAIINLMLSIYLCKIYGAVGSAVGTALSLILANGIVMNIYYHKKCNIDIFCFWKNIFRISRGLIVPLISGILIAKYVNIQTWTMLIISILIYSVFFCVSMWFLGLNSYEKNMVLEPFYEIRRKMKGSNQRNE